MTIRDNLEFHAAELFPVPGGGVALTRIPRAVSETLIPRGRFVAQDSVNTEIRFYTRAPRIHLYLSAQEAALPEKELEISVYFGDFEQKTEFLPCGGGIREIVIERPPALDVLKKEMCRRAPGIGFDSNVVRIIPGRGMLIYHGIDALGEKFRPPAPEEKPALKCLAYGSSITNSRTLGYPFVMTHTLGMELYNLGMSGSCYMEPALVEWMSCQDWNISILELGINVLHFSIEEFTEKAEYTVRKFAETGKPVFVLTMFPYVEGGKFAMENCANGNYDAFNQILRALCKKNQRKNLVLIEGNSIADDLICLSCDLLHPRSYGHIRMGLNLAKVIREFLPGMGTKFSNNRS